MPRKKLQPEEKLVSANATVKPSLRKVIEKLAQDRQWTFAKAAAHVMERGAEADKLFDKYGASDVSRAQAA